MPKSLSEKFCWQTLPPHSTKILPKLIFLKEKGFILGGGTAIALHLGHRISVDFDFFTADEFKPDFLAQEISTKISPLKIINQDKNTLEGFLKEKIRLHLMTYPYPLLKKPIIENGLAILQLEDLAAIKLSTISSRGSKKDFIDLYEIMKSQNWPIDQIFQFFAQKYQGVEYSHYHLLRSLVYFAEAESEPMPRMIKTISWSQVKKHFELIAKEAKF